MKIENYLLSAFTVIPSRLSASAKQHALLATALHLGRSLFVLASKAPPAHRKSGHIIAPPPLIIIILDIFLRWAFMYGL